ncbi:MAG: type IV pilin protein [Nitrospiria bacterium]
MKNNKGFTLIELMVAVAVVGILADIAIPTYLNYLAKSQQTEARTNLGAIFVGMHAYTAPKIDDGFSGATLKNIGYTTSGKLYYTYSLITVTTNTFLARANGIYGRVVGDVWEIDEKKDIQDKDPDFNK